MKANPRIQTLAAALVAANVFTLACETLGATLHLWPECGATPIPSPIHLGTATRAEDGSLLCAGICPAVNCGPGIAFFIPEEMRDFSRFGRIDARVRNLTGMVIEVCLAAKGGGGDRRNWLRLAPNGAGTVRVPLRVPELLDRPVDLKGMHKKPDSTDDQKRFDPSLVQEISLYNNKPAAIAERVEFAIEEIVATGEPTEATTINADALFPLVDEYGQLRVLDWPGKAHGPSDLEKARLEESAWLDAEENAFAADRDRWGGWASGPQLTATGAFRTEKLNGKWWLVDPDGHLFWSHGVTCVAENSHRTKTGGREKFFTPFKALGNGPFRDCASFWPDGAAAIANFNFLRANIRRKYIGAWRGEWRYGEHAHRRIHAWGLNTLGNWSDSDICLQRKTPYTVDCSPWFRKLEGGKVPDPFDSEFVESLGKAILELRAVGIADDPWCIGFFVNNEIRWGDTSPDVAEEYFSKVADTIHRLAPGRLYLGCRFAEFEDGGGEAIYRIAAKYCDILTSNIYKPLPVPVHGMESDFPDCPTLVGEFHFHVCGTGQFAGGACWTPEERSMLYKEFVRCALGDPRCVGAHWFQWADQPVTGRGQDGENFPCGFVDICDRPHEDLVSAAREIAAEMYQVRFGNLSN